MGDEYVFFFYEFITGINMINKKNLECEREKYTPKETLFSMLSQICVFSLGIYQLRVR